MRLILDTNIFLEIILEQEKAAEAKALLSKTDQHEFFISTPSGFFCFAASSMTSSECF